MTIPAHMTGCKLAAFPAHSRTVSRCAAPMLVSVLSLDIIRTGTGRDTVTVWRWPGPRTSPLPAITVGGAEPTENSDPGGRTYSSTCSLCTVWREDSLGLSDCTR